MKKQNGAVMVEALIAMFLFLGLLGGFFTYALALHRYSALSDAVTSSLRKVSTNVNISGHNGNYKPQNLISSSHSAFIGNTIKQFILDHNYSRDTSEIVVNGSDAKICRATSGLCQITVKASWQTPCFFCFYTGSLSTTIQLDSGFEDPCFIANGSSGCGMLTLGECISGS